MVRGLAVVDVREPHIHCVERAVQAAQAPRECEAPRRMSVVDLLRAENEALKRENTALRRENVDLRQKLDDHKIIRRAQGVLMERKRLTEAAAYRLIQKTAMDCRMALRDLAREILDTGRLP